MDATLKRKMKKAAIVAAVYFTASLLLIIFSNLNGNTLWFPILKKSCETATLVLHPQIILLASISRGSLSYKCAIISVPLWSLCFGWLYVQFTDWLNHFPVLGKRVF
jgi:hypothetical protein